MPDLSDIWANPGAYLPPKSSLWLWIGGPLIIALVYFITSQVSGERKRRLREAEIWRASVGPAPVADNKQGAPYRPDPKKKKKKDEAKPAKKPVGPPRVLALPPALQGALTAVGGGEAIAHYELVTGVAYLSLMEANGTAGSDYQAVTAKLEERGPYFLVRPLPIVDGARTLNNGVQFKKDPDFMRLFLVEGADAKGIGRWLSGPLRRALCELPDAWLRVEGTTMTLTVFGSLEAPQLDALVEAADTIFAEHGADGGASLFGDHAVATIEAPVPSGKRSAAPAISTLAETPMAKKKG